MASTGSVTGAWHPKTESERQLVRSQLEKIVSDGRFAASQRYPPLLRYIVEQTLAGNEDNLKERTLGVEVFHRPPDYDTNLDPVVRLCAAEVRKRLAQYYQSPAHAGELRIELNPGSYVPVFSQPAPDAPALEGDSGRCSLQSGAGQPAQEDEKNLLAGGFDSSCRDHRRDIRSWARVIGGTSRNKNPLSKNKSPLSKKSGLRCSPAASLSCSVWANRSFPPFLIPR